ncbi:Integrin alpha-5 [Platysternon megacephalum]|uniref:Interleukin family protein n=1 Tax=Platysternon megacephalum TaxID=55544 RepID=A0A4D9DT35_9SAUR|nr:Integrin alpha-5 [Platysternon megacephalum]
MNVNEIRASFTAIKATIQAKDAIRTISILSYPYSLHNFNSADRCCIIHHLLRFYVDKVFKHCETEDSHVNRKISSIANSFLSIKKKFRQCNEQNVCDCGEEAIEKYKQILTNYGQQPQRQRDGISQDKTEHILKQVFTASVFLSQIIILQQCNPMSNVLFPTEQLSQLEASFCNLQRSEKFLPLLCHLCYTSAVSETQRQPQKTPLGPLCDLCEYP